jgi:small subunit ribosomal protein S20
LDVYYDGNKEDSKVAQHESAKKRVRSNGAKANRNRVFLSAVKTAVKQFRSAFEKAESSEQLNAKYVKAQSLLSKAVTKGMLHKNAASRKISNLNALLKKKEK